MSYLFYYYDLCSVTCVCDAVGGGRNDLSDPAKLPLCSTFPVKVTEGQSIRLLIYLFVCLSVSSPNLFYGLVIVVVETPTKIRL